MTELENLYQRKFVLECKDHWTTKDWTTMDQLNKRILELDPPKAKSRKWVKVIRTFPNGFEYDYEGKVFERDSLALVNFIATNNIANYELREV